MSAESKTYRRRRNLEGHAELKRQAETNYCGVGQQLNAQLKSLDSNNINAALARIQLERPELEEELRAEEDAVLKRLAKEETIIPTPAAEAGQFLEDLTTALELAQNSSLSDVADWRFAVFAQWKKFADLAESLGVDPTPFQSHNPIQQRRAVLERVQRKHQIQLREQKPLSGAQVGTQSGLAFLWMRLSNSTPIDEDDADGLMKHTLKSNEFAGHDWHFLQSKYKNYLEYLGDGDPSDFEWILTWLPQNARLLPQAAQNIVKTSLPDKTADRQAWIKAGCTLMAQLSMLHRNTTPTHPVTISAEPSKGDTVEDDAPRQEPKTPAKQGKAPAEPKPSHSADFTFVNWYGTEYTFALGVQSSAVKALWDEWEQTGLGLHQETIRNAIDAERDNFRVDKVFRNHPAFGTMILNIGDGRYKLAPPTTGKAAPAAKVKKSARIPAKAPRKPR